MITVTASEPGELEAVVALLQAGVFGDLVVRVADARGAAVAGTGRSAVMYAVSGAMPACGGAGGTGTAVIRAGQSVGKQSR